MTAKEYTPSAKAGSMNFSTYVKSSWPMVSHSQSRFLEMKTSSWVWGEKMHLFRFG